MKIMSYNIHHCTQEKVDRILKQEADIYLLPELCNPDQLRIPDGFVARWTGDIDFRDSGSSGAPASGAGYPYGSIRNTGTSYHL